ncbi:hypothetical protein [Novosphingobium endophyticum]|nr:hypothetical protein [Novosphingobium endophyticum]
MKTRKTRHQFYLPDDLSARLDAMAAEPVVEDRDPHRCAHRLVRAPRGP